MKRSGFRVHLHRRRVMQTELPAVPGAAVGVGRRYGHPVAVGGGDLLDAHVYDEAVRRETLAASVLDCECSPLLHAFLLLLVVLSLLLLLVS